MKKQLLFLFSIITSLTYAQEPINNYFSVADSEFAIVILAVSASFVSYRQPVCTANAAHKQAIPMRKSILVCD